MLGYFQCRGALLIRIIVGHGPTVLAVSVDEGCYGISPACRLFFRQLNIHVV